MRKIVILKDQFDGAYNGRQCVKTQIRKWLSILYQNKIIYQFKWIFLLPFKISYAFKISIYTQMVEAEFKSIRGTIIKLLISLLITRSTQLPGGKNRAYGKEKHIFSGKKKEKSNSDLKKKKNRENRFGSKRKERIRGIPCGRKS